MVWKYTQRGSSETFIPRHFCRSFPHYDFLKDDGDSICHDRLSPCYFACVSFWTVIDSFRRRRLEIPLQGVVNTLMCHNSFCTPETILCRSNFLHDGWSTAIKLYTRPNHHDAKEYRARVTMSFFRPKERNVSRQEK